MARVKAGRRGSDEYYTRLAREKGYPARSVFKLREIQERFHLLASGSRVLDIGAFPGSWSRYCLELLQGRGKVVGVDLQQVRLKPPALAGFIFIQGDIFDPEVEKALLSQGPYDLVLSDAAPGTTGSATVDCQRSLELARRALEIASKGLRGGGSAVIKILQGGDEGLLLGEMRRFFAKAKAFKPAASRKESREIFLLGFRKK